ncbi:MAG: hypothetical protein C5B60_06755 [Chloroflexi bacterium]|nr:MAG: hypothetical protein C5B60_06755 [Chloroflexota bacterium]
MDEKALLYTNLLSTLGVSVVCLAAGLCTIFLSSQEPEISVRYNHELTKIVMWAFLMIGAGIKYGITMPYLMGWVQWTLPGSIQHLSSLVSSGIILMIILISRGEKQYHWFLYPLVCSEIISGLVTLSKLDVLLTMVGVILATYLCKPRLKLLIGAALGLVLLYVFILSPFVLFARLVIGSNYARETEELGTAISEYRHANRNDIAIVDSEVQGWWTRLSYANVQAFAMDSYDHGAGGQTFALLPYVLVPRVLYPDKPFMTSGKEFTQLLIGYEDESHTGLGFFGEAYWNGGWLMVMLACFYVGLLFSIFGYVSMRLILSEQYVYLPVIMIGVFTGMRPDDWFVPTVFGGIIEAICLFIGLKIVVLFLTALSTPCRKAPAV